MTKFYKTNQELESSKSNFLKEEDISEENKDQILELASECWAQGLSASRIKKYFANFNTLLTKFAPKDFSLKDATEDNLKQVVANIERSEYAERTKHDFKVALKKFYRVKNDGKQPDKVRFFSTTLSKKQKKLPEDLLNREEISDLIGACRNSRDKALISVLYESGVRIGELNSIEVKDVKFDNHGVIIQVFGKTGSRRIRLIESERRLRNWLEDHPSGEDDAPLWVKMEQYDGDYEPLSYGAIRRMLKNKAEKAGVNPDKVFPHNFRHSRATELANDMTEAQMCEYFGWVQGSDQPATYVHLSGRDIDDKILEINGMQKKEDKNEPQECPICGEKNPANAKFCRNCKRPLDREAAEKADKAKEGMNSLQDWMIENNVSKEELKEELKQILG